MANKKNHPRAPVPPGNRPHGGPPEADVGRPAESDSGGGAPFHEQDPQRRLGDFSGEGEHPFQQPGGKNDANH